jgi:hypothetical protein
MLMPVVHGGRTRPLTPGRHRLGHCVMDRCCACSIFTPYLRRNPYTHKLLVLPSTPDIPLSYIHVAIRLIYIMHRRMGLSRYPL